MSDTISFERDGDDGKVLITEPPKLDPQRAGYARTLFERSVMYEIKPDGRELMLTVDRITDVRRTQEVMDWLCFEFIRVTGGTVEAGRSVSGGKVYICATFLPPTKN